MSARTRGAVARQSAVVLVIVGVAVAVALLAIGMAAPPRSHTAFARAAPAPATPPPLPPAMFVEEAPDRARASNAAVPLAAAVVPPARPLIYRGSVEDRAAAGACLAAAALYEAGDDPDGERAVVQVVLNRVRHPAFPKTVCGVVFQGSERSTGCQFTFTCDGALERVVPPAAWARARRIAEAALTGFVYRPAGAATHYHADWVVPYWRSSLEKIAVVHTQIFYRWPGAWGSPAVLTARPQPGERMDSRVARLAGIDAPSVDGLMDADTSTPRQALAIAGVPGAALNGSIVRLKDEGAGQYVLQLGASASPASFVITAFNICGGRDDCLVLGWTSEREIPRTLPVLPAAMRSLAFLYRKSSLNGFAQPYWDCSRFRRPLASQCLERR